MSIKRLYNNNNKRNEFLTKIESEEIRRRVDQLVEVSHNEQQQERQEEIRQHQRQDKAGPPPDLETAISDLNEEQGNIKTRLLLEIKVGLTPGERPTLPNLKKFPGKSYWKKPRK